MTTESQVDDNPLPVASLPNLSLNDTFSYIMFADKV